MFAVLHASFSDLHDGEAALCFDTMLTGFFRRGAHCFGRGFSAPAPPRMWAQLRQRFLQTFTPPREIPPPVLAAGNIRLIVVLKGAGRVVANADDLAGELAQRLPNLVASKITVEDLSIGEQLALVASAHILLCQTGTASITLGIFLPAGGVLIEILQYVGRNQSVSMAGEFMRTPVCTCGWACVQKCARTCV